MVDEKKEGNETEKIKIVDWAKRYSESATVEKSEEIIKEVDEYIQNIIKPENFNAEHDRIIHEIKKTKQSILKKEKDERLPPAIEDLDRKLEELKQQKKIIREQEKIQELIEKQKIKEEKEKIKQQEKETKQKEKELKRQEKISKQRNTYNHVKIDYSKQSDEKITILDVFSEEELNLFNEQNDGSMRGPCPQCGEGSGADPFMLYPDSNTAYCHKTVKKFNLMETFALKYKIIDCDEGREEGESTVLRGHLLKETYDAIEAEKGREFLNRMNDALRRRKELDLPERGKLISEFADEIGNILKDKNFLYYRPGAKKVVEVSDMEVETQDKESAYFIGFDSIEPDRFITLIERFIIPLATTTDANGEEIKYPKSLTINQARAVLSSPNFINKLPIIKRVLTAQIPMIHENELVLPKQGYDGRFYSYLPFNAPLIKNKEMPVKQAKENLVYLIRECCFKTKQDYTNAISAMITPFVRGLFSRFNKRTPVFVYIANRERAGKDFLAGMSSMIYEGFVIEETPISHSGDHGGSEDELRKKILSAFLDGKKKLHFANNKGFIDNSVFEALVTNERFSDRMLGKNLSLSFDNELDISLSGNIGFGYTADFTNRARFIKLFLEIEDANSRTFETPDMWGYIRENREMILESMYALIREWIKAGRPKSPIPFTSFPEWADVVGGILVYNNLGNPCVPELDDLITKTGGDSETYEMKQFYEICYETYGENFVKKEDLQDLAMKQQHLFSYLDWEKRGDRIKFSMKLTRYNGRILSGIALMVQNDASNRSDRNLFKFTKDKTACKIISAESFLNESCGESLSSLSNPSSCTEVSTLKYNNINNNIYNNNNIFSHCSSDSVSWKTKMTSLTEENTKKPVKSAKKSKKLSEEQIDRQLQYWESPECENIKATCTREMVLDYLAKNVPVHFEKLIDDLPLGVSKIIAELLSEKKIRRDGMVIHNVT